MYRNILVPLDGSALSEAALPTAIALARGLGAKLVLVRSATEDAPWRDGSPEAEYSKLQDTKAYLAGVASRLANQGVRVETVTTDIEPGDAILLESRLRRADLVVMCTDGRIGPEPWQAGAVAADDFALLYDVPVLLVRPTDATAQKPLKSSAWLVALNGSAFAEAVLPSVSTLAASLGAKLVLMRVVEPQLYDQPVGYDELSASQEAEQEEMAEAEAYLAGVADRLTALGLNVQTQVCLGPVAEMIVVQAEVANAGLVAMAAHGPTGLPELINGSVPRQVFEQDSRSLLLVRPLERRLHMAAA